MHAVDAGGVKLLLVRFANEIIAVDALCPHAQAPLVEGALCGRRLICPWHQSVFALPDGALLDPPALDGLRVYPVEVRHGNVFVTLSDEPARGSRVAHAPTASDSTRTLVVIGAGAAGQAAVEALRAEGFRGRLVLIGREEVAPYDRTNLSKHFLTGDAGEEKLPLRPAGFLEDLGVERIVQQVTLLDAPAKTLHFADGTTLSYDGAILATGGTPRMIEVPGAELPGAQTLRTFEDARHLVAAAQPGTHAVVIGASFIGLEVASSLRQRGLEVTVVSPVQIPFERQLGRRVGESLRRLHEEHGVKFPLGAEVERFAAAAEGQTRVDLSSGATLRAHLVVIGIGVRPATDFVRGAARAEDGGIIVDEYLHAGHALYAAGDLANFPVRQPGDSTVRVRIEHWRVAQQHARLAARNLAAGRPEFTLDDAGFVPFFWTFHFGQRLNYVGHADGGDEVIFAGDPANPPYIAYYVRNGRMLAAAGVGRDADLAAVHELLRTGQAPDAQTLARGSFSPLAFA
jgi:NADPH-dependent 2,4-dienoyl-CoA reductase/sulfur reductase-like enzyme/nitrite reductase/ring-hydroxylating ferredoxin subunit